MNDFKVGDTVMVVSNVFAGEEDNTPRMGDSGTILKIGYSYIDVIVDGRAGQRSGWPFSRAEIVPRPKTIDEWEGELELL